MAETIGIISVLFFSIILHECAHGLTALWCGDPTAKEQGRLTLNPVSHIDPFGTVILPGLLILMRTIGAPLFPIGWAKPVPVNFSRLRHLRRDMFLVGLSGPLTNILIALIATAGYHLLGGVVFWARDVFRIFIVVNLILAFFNLVPIPPLDGSRLVLSVLPKSLATHYVKFERFGIIIVIVLLNFGLFHIIGLLVGMVLRALEISAYF